MSSRNKPSLPSLLGLDRTSMAAVNYFTRLSRLCCTSLTGFRGSATFLTHHELSVANLCDCSKQRKFIKA
eukprot:6081803-Amphidinium_carterae.1